MKKIIIWASLSIGCLLLLGYFVPILVSSSKARPLYGYFDIDFVCVCGHEKFLYLDEGEAYYLCPGHRDRGLIGRLERYDDSVVIHRQLDDIPRVRIELKDGEYVIISFDDSSTYQLKQVNNPWRTWLPGVLPEN